MKLYRHPVSLMPWRVPIALAEKGRDCEEQAIDLPGGASRQPDFLALDPFGQAPVLEDDDRPLAESMAWANISGVYRPFFPRPPRERACTRSGCR